MDWRKWVSSMFCCGILIFWSANAARAFHVDPTEKSLEIIAKLQSRVSLRLQDSEGFTQPIEIGVGDLVQWRNLALIEINHDLWNLTRELDVLRPLKALKIRSKYHLVGRFMYDAVYNVGPQAYQDVRANDKENIDNFKQAYDLWEFYLDFSKGPGFLRIGRQILAWGETDGFRLLDNICPLDNTFGGIFEDLDDRRIPLWMLRGSYNFGQVGPIATFTLEGFWVPGNWDTRVAPLSPAGTPYAVAAPETPLSQVVLTPAKKMSNSRWGVKLGGMLANNYNWNIAYQKTWLDIPALRLAVGESVLDAATELSYGYVDILGGSLSFWEQRTDTIVRAEVSYTWDEPVFIPEVSTPLVPTGLPIPGLEVLPANGTIPKKDVLRWMIGLDKNLWIRPLNPVTTFLVSVQYFSTWVQDYDDRMRQPLALYPEADNYALAKEIETLFTAIVSTNYLQGDLSPLLSLFYDVRGAWLVGPSVTYRYGPFRFQLAYNAVLGNFTGIGAFRDRDQISFILNYLLD